MESALKSLKDGKAHFWERKWKRAAELLLLAMEFFLARHEIPEKPLAAGLTLMPGMEVMDWVRWMPGMRKKTPRMRATPWMVVTPVVMLVLSLALDGREEEALRWMERVSGASTEERVMTRVDLFLFMEKNEKALEELELLEDAERLDVLEKKAFILCKMKRHEEEAKVRDHVVSIIRTGLGEQEEREGRAGLWEDAAVDAESRRDIALIRAGDEEVLDRWPARESAGRWFQDLRWSVARSRVLSASAKHRKKVVQELKKA